MKLYRLELDVNNIKCSHFPRVPEILARNENNNIKRVCLSSSIEGAINSAPWGGGDIEDLFIDGFMPSILIRVYVYNINEDDENLIHPIELYKQDLVPDAIYTDEHWYLDEISYDETFLIEITSFYGFVSEDDISYKDMEYIKANNVEDIELYINGCFTMVDGIKYNKVSEDNITNFLLLDHNILSSKDDILIKVEILKSYLPESEKTFYDIIYDDKSNKYKIIGEFDIRNSSINKENINSLLSHVFDDSIEF